VSDLRGDECRGWNGEVVDLVARSDEGDGQGKDVALQSSQMMVEGRRGRREEGCG